MPGFECAWADAGGALAARPEARRATASRKGGRDSPSDANTLRPRPLRLERTFRACAQDDGPRPAVVAARRRSARPVRPRGGLWQADAVAGIYLKHGDAYVSMIETPYDSEGVLQALIAQHPEILADEDAGQGPLLLVRREAAVSDQEDAGGRWSLDHLYLDRDGVPTLVEVKRSSDTRGRREVVAQMLDYAANAKTSFSADRMAAWLEDEAQAGGASVAQVLSDTLGVEDPEAFWATVATNIDAERFRLVFISDVIPPELRRIIEYLNGQMSRTVVLAIEVKQYVDDEARHQTIVPRVIGDTETAKRAKRTPSSATTDRASLLSALATVDPRAAQAAEALLDWGAEHPGLRTRWTRAGDIGLATYQPGLLRIWPEGTLELKVDTLRKVDAAWDNDTRVEELLQRLEQIDGVKFFKGSRQRWPRTALAPLADPAPRRRFLETLADVLSGLRVAA